jgi:hypothetical protein
MADKNSGRFLDDAESLAALIQTLLPGEREVYESYGALSLESGFPNRRMVVYTLRDGQPGDLSMVLMGDMEMTRIGGPTLTMIDEQGPVVLSVKPQRWRGRDLFMQVPQNFILKWKGKQIPGKGVQFVPHYAILLKTRSKEHHQVEGDTYCVTLNKFRERFPEVPVRY